jgi:general secretion pathway protein D
VLNALASDANTNILSTPTLVTLDNEEAEIVIGENVPFVTGSFTSTGAGDSATNPFQTIQREDVGLTLKIKPQINEGDAMRLDIEQEVSSIADSVAGAADIITNTRSIKTNVMVDDGQVVVLGGLIEEQVLESVQKVPLLGDIPYLGALFRSKTSDVKKTNLMVFIHPVILRDAEVMNSYTNAKYNDIRVLQMQQNNDGINMLPGKQQPVLPNMQDYTIVPVPGNPEAPAEYVEDPVPVTGEDSAPPAADSETLFE